MRGKRRGLRRWAGSSNAVLSARVARRGMATRLLVGKSRQTLLGGTACSRTRALIAIQIRLYGAGRNPLCGQQRCYVR